MTNKHNSNIINTPLNHSLFTETYNMATYSLKHSIPYCIMTLQGHPRSSIYMLFESQYATYY